jgi:hypothetical protein
MKVIFPLVKIKQKKLTISTYIQDNYARIKSKLTANYTAANPFWMDKSILAPTNKLNL